LEEAERLMREELRDNNINHVVYMNNTRLLCSILMTQEKFAEAKQIISPCLQKMQRVFGPSHHFTKDLLSLDSEICADLDEMRQH